MPEVKDCRRPASFVAGDQTRRRRVGVLLWLLSGADDKSPRTQTPACTVPRRLVGNVN